jgi:hypothetical protein
MHQRSFGSACGAFDLAGAVCTFAIEISNRDESM